MESPKVSFNFVNDNVWPTVPLNGVSAVLARTSRGPKNDPSVLIKSLAQFREIYGEELVPDGSVSNIETALKLGSKLRIARVLGEDATYGYVSGDSTVTGDIPQIIKFAIGTVSTPKVFGFGLVDKNPGSNIGTGIKFNIYRNTSSYKNGNIYYQVTDVDGMVLDSGLFMSIFAESSALSPDTYYFDTQIFRNFIQSNKYFDVVMTTTNSDLGITTVSDMLNYLETTYGTQTGTADFCTLYQSVDGYISMVDEYDIDETLTHVDGDAGDAPEVEDWEEALNTLKDYTDMYHVTASHVHQNLSGSDLTTFYNSAKDLAVELEEWLFFEEVSKSNTSANAIVTAAQGLPGRTHWIAKFGCGIKYYDNQGILKDSDVMGSILGLADASASEYGPWRSFAGMNRGLLVDAVGPVSDNFGSPSRYDELNKLANDNVNAIVVKDTRTMGKQTMLWHCFTDGIRQDSFKFISVVQLCLYIKKNLRPLLESYIEEPNIWDTWKKIYQEGKPIMDNLLTQEAISEYTWNGDQFASSYEDLQVNNEADVRKGKYKLRINFKDIVPMQDISVTLQIDKVSRSVTATIE